MNQPTFRYSIRRTTDYSTLPFTDDELKRAVRLIDSDAQLDELKAKCQYAMQYIEEKAKHACLTGTYVMTFRRFPMLPAQPTHPSISPTGPVYLPRSPATSITSVQYADVDGVTQTLSGSDYQLNIEREPAVLTPARLRFWPVVDPWTLTGVTITFVAGYANAAAVPPKYKEALRFLTAYRFFNRESDADGKIPESLKLLVSSLKIGDVD